MSVSSQILVGQVGSLFWLRVEGRGTFRNSIQVREAINASIRRGTKDIVIDLESCPIMDSTFLGTLTGSAVQLRDSEKGDLHVINANQRNLQLIQSLGLDYLLKVDIDGSAWTKQRQQVAEQLAQCAEAPSVNNQIQAAHVLEAHIQLAGVSDENQCRFEDVILFLEKELAKQDDG